VRWSLIAFVLLVIVGAASGGSKKTSKHTSSPPVTTTTATTATLTTVATTSTPATVARTVTHRSHAKAHTPAKPKPRPTRSLTGSAGLMVSDASNDVVQRQPAPGSCHVRGSGLMSEPDPGCTPGALNPAVTQQAIDQTICVSGWTKTVRPSESVTEQEKTESMAAYGDTDSPHDYEYDHLVSLELGGATNDARNLWPEPGASPNPKDSVENALHRLVCDGQMPLARAQHIIATNWVSWAQANDVPSGESTTTPAVTTSTQPATRSPTPAPSSSQVVHPGSYCAPEGAQGATEAGTPMTCKPSATDSRARWRRS
jgi:hypothetical protein